jgi:GH15 family glucan-1,4-alpha-glucosidase
VDLAHLGLIGNCQLSALVDASGAIVFSCMPRFDSEPLFGALLDPDGGAFSIGVEGGALGVQRYLPNTNVLTTTFTTRDGSFRVLDFAPRFIQNERSFRPTKLLRIVEPLSGTPRVVVRCDPRLGWSKERPQKDTGSHHVSYLGYPTEVRLTTDIPISYLDGESFALTATKHFVFSWGAPVEEALAPLCQRFLSETTRYWQRWVKACAVPLLHQEEVIRSALALKLHCFEDTGAIVAALTTSLPEAPGSGRNWDYRYCWLRDAYYTLEAFRLLGRFEEREQFLEFLLDITGRSEDLELAPLYRVDGRSDLEERILPNWAGYEGHGPVRVGNGAALHKQHDVFGEMVLALTPMFLDARFVDHITPQVLELVTGLARKAIAVAGRPDAGIWEYRTEWRPQTFSSLMCWAATDRMARIARRHRPGLEDEFRAAAVLIEREVIARAVDEGRNTLVADYGGTEVDAALLQAVTLGLLEPGDVRARGTIAAVRADLEFDGWLRRYRIDDGFGRPEVAFALCTFWCIEALARTGQLDDARAMLVHLLGSVNAPLGLLAEDVHVASRRMWGNFPQAYSHAGLIHAAFAVSPRYWDA